MLAMMIVGDHESKPAVEYAQTVRAALHGGAQKIFPSPTALSDHQRSVDDGSRDRRRADLIVSFSISIICSPRQGEAERAQLLPKGFVGRKCQKPKPHPCK